MLRALVALLNHPTVATVCSAVAAGASYYASRAGTGTREELWASVIAAACGSVALSARPVWTPEQRELMQMTPPYGIQVPKEAQPPVVIDDRKDKP